MDILSILITKALNEGALRPSHGHDGRIVLQAKVGASWITVAEATRAELQPERKKPTLELVQ